MTGKKGIANRRRIVPSPADEWQVDAKCRSLSPADSDRLFFRDSTFDEGKKYCVDCPVISECLQYALTMESVGDSRDRFGLWGGMTPAERTKFWKMIQWYHSPKPSENIEWLNRPETIQ